MNDDYRKDPAWLELYGEVKPYYSSPLPVINDQINEDLDKVSPINSDRGVRSSVLERVFDGNSITPAEKALIEQNLVKVPSVSGTDSFVGLSDDDLVQMLPSRYSQTEVDREAVRQYFSRQIFNDPAVVDEISRLNAKP